MVQIKFSKFWFGLLIVFVAVQQIQCTEDESEQGCFRAAVYEHLPIKNPTDKPLQVLRNNYAIVERVVKRASFVDTKIIVLPEYSLMPSSLGRSQLLGSGVTAISPDLNSNLCSVYKEKLKNITQSNQSDIQKGEQMQALDRETQPISEKILVNSAILRKISCLAAENNLYVAINLVTLENTNSPNDLKIASNGDPVSSELDTLKQSDQLINDKLTDQLKKIDKEQSPKNGKLEDYLLFNTELVFDNQGELVAKYKKFNLFNEKELNRTELQLATFATPYGKFGIAVCSDLLFEQPIKDLAEKEKIDHLILSSAWFMDLPALAGLDLQAALAIKYKINVLSANQRNFSRGAFGSAIFNGKLGLRVQTSFDNQDRLLIADLPTGSLNNANDYSTLSSNEKVDIQTIEYSNLDSLDSIVSKVDASEFKKGKCSHFDSLRIAEETYQQFSYVFRDNTFFGDYRASHVPLNLFQAKRLENTEGSLTNVCDKSVCCELEWKMNSRFNFASDNFYLAAISRLKQSADPSMAWFEQSCSLVSKHQSKPEYKLVSSTHFDKLSLRGKFNTTTILPNVMSSVFYVVPSHKWSFKQVYNEAELSFNDLRRPITFVTLYGRVFEKDEVINKN